MWPWPSWLFPSRPRVNFNIRIDHHHHFGGDDYAEKLLGALMALSDDLKALTAQIDAATTKVADRIGALTGQIKNSMTDDEVASVKAGLQAEIDRLVAIGADPANPVPTP